MEESSRNVIGIVNRLGWLLLVAVAVVLVVVLVVAFIQSGQQEATQRRWSLVDEGLQARETGTLDEKIKQIDDQASPAFAAGAWHLGWMRLQDNQYDGARQVFELAADNTDNPLLAGMCRYGEASTDLAMNERDKARETFSDLAANGPAFIRLWADQRLEVMDETQKDLELIAQGKDPARQRAMEMKAAQDEAEKQVERAPEDDTPKTDTPKPETPETE